MCARFGYTFRGLSCRERSNFFRAEKWAKRRRDDQRRRGCLVVRHGNSAVCAKRIAAVCMFQMKMALVCGAAPYRARVARKCPSSLGDDVAALYVGYYVAKVTVVMFAE